MILGRCFLLTYFEVFEMGKDVALAASIFCRSTGNSDTLHGYACSSRKMNLVHL